MNKEMTAKRQALEAELASDMAALRRKQVYLGWFFLLLPGAKMSNAKQWQTEEQSAAVEKEKAALKAQAAAAAANEQSAQKTAHAAAMAALATTHRAELDKAEREHKAALQALTATQKAEQEKTRQAGEAAIKPLHAEIEQLRDACERDLQTQRETLAKQKVVHVAGYNFFVC